MLPRTMSAIENLVAELAKMIDAPTAILPTYGFTEDGARPHVEIGTGGTLHYVVVERGVELDRRTTADTDQLLFWVFEAVTFSMAIKFEGTHRVAGQDSRRCIFAWQEALLGQLNAAWMRDQQLVHQSTLQRYPFDDLAAIRASYSSELRKAGYATPDIEKLAFARYPAN
jgi:hypothetical protein